MADADRTIRVSDLIQAESTILIFLGTDPEIGHSLNWVSLCILGAQRVQRGIPKTVISSV